MKKFVVLDSNVIVSFFENSFSIAQRKGIFSEPEEIGILKKLLNALEKNQIHLIIPEVVIFECERIKEQKKEELKKLFQDTESHLNTVSVIPNKTMSFRLRKKISSMIGAAYKEECDEIENAWKIFKDITNHRNSHIKELDEKILLNSYKRGLKGVRPFLMRYSNAKDPDFNNKPLHDIQPDCIIVESIKLFLASETNYELYLITNDCNFFTSNDKKLIHSDIQNDLNIKAFYLTISDFLEKVLKIKFSKKKITDEAQQDKEINAFPSLSEGKITEGKFENSFDIVKG
jgi:hypothetical protein